MAEEPTKAMLACDHKDGWRKCNANVRCEVCDLCGWHTTLEGPKPDKTKEN